MRVSILADTNWESKIDHALKVLSLQEAFDRDFGSELAAITLVLNCRDPELRHKQRIRHDKSTKTLYVDVMLDLRYFVQATHTQRRAKIAEQAVVQLGAVLAKRRIVLFDVSLFLAQLTTVLNEQLNGPESTRYDHLCLERSTGY